MSKGLALLRERWSECGANLLGSYGGWVGRYASCHALVSGFVVVLPERNDLVIVGLPSADEPGAMSQLHRQQMRVEELVERRQVLRNRGITTDAVEHPRRVRGALHGAAGLSVAPVTRLAPVAAALLATICVGCTDAQQASRSSQSDSPSASSSSPPMTVAASPIPSKADEELDGVVKAGPTVRLRETDEFGIVVRTERHSGVVQATVDRVDSLTGEEGERAAAARGMDYANDHFEVNESARTRLYTVAQDVEIWLANPSDVGNPKPLTVSEWRNYVARTSGRERPPMFHFDVEDGRVVGIEEQYLP